MKRMPLPLASLGLGRREDLVAAAIARDRRAFDGLVERHTEPLRQFLARRVPVGRLDDLVQDVWLAAWISLPKFDYRSGFQTWLLAIGLNKVRDLYRRERRTFLEVPLDDIASVVSSPSQTRETDSIDAVRSMVARLPEKQREVIEMYYCCDYTLPEVASLLGRNLNTVKYQFYAAHAELAIELRGVE